MSRRRHSEAGGGGSAVRRTLQALLVVVVLPILVGGVVMLVAGRPAAFEALRWRIERRFPDVKWIDPEGLAHQLSTSAEPRPVLLDARTEAEFAVSHLQDAIRVDPYRPSLRAIQGFRKDTSVVVYSSAGYRGGRVADWLGRVGYTAVHNLAGGIFAWVNAGRPISEGNGPAATVHPYDHIWGLLVKSRYRAQAADVERRSAAP